MPRTPLRTALVPLSFLSLLGACGAPRTGKPPLSEPSMPNKTFSIEVSVRGDGTPAAAVRCVVRNVSDHPVHVFDARRMPYLLDEEGALVVLHGVHPPPQDRDLNLIQIPTTRPIAAGESLTFEAALQPLQLHGHYGDEPSPPRHGPVKIICRVAHGATPIDAAAQHQLSIQALLEWQTLESSAVVVVQLP